MGKLGKHYLQLGQRGGWCLNCEFRNMGSQVIVNEEELVVGYLKLLECINKINLDTRSGASEQLKRTSHKEYRRPGKTERHRKK